MSWRGGLVTETGSIRDAIAAIDGGSHQIALVVGENGELRGTITDGDVRRAILRGISLESPAREIMSKDPIAARSGDSSNVLLAKMRARGVHQLPLLDEQGRVVGVETLDHLINVDNEDNVAVVMAGGLGSRLSPLTDDIPKPLLEIGGKPLLETIIEQLVSHGFRRLHVAVNYLAQAVKDRLGDGSVWGAEITYLEETKRMGTAGALSLLPERPASSFLVMNGDLLTNVNLRHLFAYHQEQRCAVTMCVREYVDQLRYGVVEIEDNQVVAIREKPTRRNFINAGIYVVEPPVLQFLPSNEFFDMTTMIENLLRDGLQTAVFPVREFWLDVGRHDDYLAASEHYNEIFS